MMRREFIAGLAGAAAWPIRASAQQPERVRRVGILMNLSASDPRGQKRLATLRQGLQELRWVEGRNVRIEIRGKHRGDRASGQSGNHAPVSKHSICPRRANGCDRGTTLASPHIYAGGILKGAKPADLPVASSSCLATAKGIGLDIPPTRAG